MIVRLTCQTQNIRVIRFDVTNNNFSIFSDVSNREYGNNVLYFGCFMFDISNPIKIYFLLGHLFRIKNFIQNSAGA